MLADLVRDGGQLLRVGHRPAHGQLMVEAGFRLMKGGGQIEDRASLLDGDDPAGGEGPSVTDPLDLVHDRHPGTAGPQKVRVQRVDRAVPLGGPPGRHERLARDLPAEDPLEALLRTSAPEDVHLDLLKIQQIDQLLGGIGHDRWPSVASLDDLGRGRRPTADPRR